MNGYVSETRPGEPGHVWDSGATSFEVHQAIIALENESSLYPRKEKTEKELITLAAKFAMVKITSGAQSRELRKLWMEHVVDDTVYDEYAALSLMRPDDNRINLPPATSYTFSKEAYTKVKDLMVKAGGKYSKNGFTFKKGTDGQDILRRLLQGEELNDKKKFQFFATPTELADIVRKEACIGTRDTVLEPSAGHGSLLDGVQAGTIHCCELNEDNRAVLYDKGYELVGDDFLEYDPAVRYDVIIANPPFTKNQDIKHVRHMYDLLDAGGRLVSIMATGWKTGQTKLQTEFRSWLESTDHKVIDIEAGAFRSSGTQVATCIVVVDKGLI